MKNDKTSSITNFIQICALFTSYRFVRYGLVSVCSYVLIGFVFQVNNFPSEIDFIYFKDHGSLITSLIINVCFLTQTYVGQIVRSGYMRCYTCVACCPSLV